MTSAEAVVIRALDSIRAAVENLNRPSSGFPAVSRAIGEMGSHGVTGIQATSAALRTLEGGITNNLRAAERFLATTLGLGEHLKDIFPIVGGIAFGGVLLQLGEHAGKLYEKYKTLQEVQSKLAAGFEAINLPLEQTNAELQVSNDKLDNEIAKLTGHPQNGLKLALDEAIVSSDKLSDSLAKTFAAAERALTAKDSSVGFFGHILGKAETGFVGDDVKELQKKLQALQSGATDKILSTPAGDNAGKLAIETQLRVDQEKVLRDALEKVNQQLAQRKQLQADAAAVDGGPRPGERAFDFQQRAGASRVAGGDLDQNAVVEALTRTRQTIFDEITNIALTDANEAKVKTRDVLKAANENAKAAASDPFRNYISGLDAATKGAQEHTGVSYINEQAVASAKAFGEATKAIQRLNEEYAKLGKSPLSNSQELTVFSKNQGLEEKNLVTKTREEAEKSAKHLDELQAELNLKLEEEATRRGETLKTLDLQIEAAKKLSAAADRGPEAERRAQAEVHLSGIQDPEIRAKASEVADLEERARVKTAVKHIQDQIDATNVLTATQRKGIDAQRAAKLEDIRTGGENQDVIKAKLAQAQAGFNLEDSVSLRGARPVDGIKAAFEELRNQSDFTAKKIHDTLGGAMDGLNNQLAALVTGQKTNWSGFFAGIAADIAKIGFGNLEKSLLSFGGFGGSGSGGFSGILSAIFGGHKAEGGDVEPGKLYDVGEYGRETVSFGANGMGHITPANKSGGQNGGASYYIDATGANSADVEARVQRAIKAVHGSAVRDATIAKQEQRARSVRGKY